MSAFQLITSKARALSCDELTWCCALNDRYAACLSEETPDSLNRLFQTSAFFSLAQPEAGFLLCADEACPWPGANFAWLAARFQRFCYVDRIAVDGAWHGRGVGRALYETGIGQARSAGHKRLVCEVNIAPANYASLSFHAAMGFERIGEATHADLGKTVAYFEKAL